MTKRFAYGCVTGATGGLGQALCHLLAKQGIPLLLTARDEQKLKNLARELPTATEIFAANLSDANSRRQLLALIHKKTADLLINNAGYGLYGDALSHSLEEQLDILEVNGKAVVELTLETARALLQNSLHGTILNVSSAAAFFPFPSFCLYAASKTFVNQFSQGLDAELKENGIRVLTACPGQINTLFRSRAAKGYPQAAGPSLATLSPEKVAQAIWEQIQTGKSLSIIDWRYKLATFAEKLIPGTLLKRLLKKSLRDRY